MISALAKSTWCICQALSKGFLALPKGLLHVHSIPNKGVLVLLATPWQALPKGLHVHSSTYVSPRLALPKGMLEVPDEIRQKICCSWGVVSIDCSIDFTIDFSCFWVDFFYWFSCSRNLCFVLIRSTHKINICNWFHRNFFNINSLID